LAAAEAPSLDSSTPADNSDSAHRVVQPSNSPGEYKPVNLPNNEELQQQLLPPPLPPPAADQCREEVTMLASLCPISVPEDYLADLFINASHKDLQSAANRILEQSPEVLQAEVIAWEASTSTLAAVGASIDQGLHGNTNTNNTESSGGNTRVMTGNSPLKPDEELRRSIVAKFHLESIPNGGGKGGGGGGKAKSMLAAWGPQNNTNTGTGAQKLRYRDGVVVATKGEKFIIEKEPEWDGGSRGKVKSKGKRGVGWQ
jgi:hypothetical protein